MGVDLKILVSVLEADENVEQAHRARFFNPADVGPHEWVNMGFVLTASLYAGGGPEYSSFSCITAEKKNTPDRNVCVFLIKGGNFFSHL